MEVVTTMAEEEYERSFKPNVFIAAFTTSFARLKLYDALDFLYYDTDSVIYKTKPRKAKVECKVRGFTLNYETLQSLNDETMKSNILKELDEPLQERRVIPISIPDFFERNQVTKKIKLIKRVKKYGVVFDKRVIDPTTRVFTPYGYNWFGGDAELLMSL